MSKTCPACAMEASESSRKSPTWVPLITAVGVSAAAFLVFRQVRKARKTFRLDDVLDNCSRAASDLDRRISDSLAALSR